MGDQPTDEERFIERIGIQFDEMGIGRTPGRIIGSLMINDPPYMNMNELVEKTSMSKASISTGLALLTQIGFIERFSIPTERADYYRIENDFWKKSLHTKITALSGFTQAIDEALSLIGNKAEDEYPDRTKTLEEMLAMYRFFENKLPDLFEEWDQIRKDHFSN